MKGKNLVLTVGVLAVCAGAAFAAPQDAPKVRQAKAPRMTRVDPISITPIYMVDGVEVYGEPIPYNSMHNRVSNHRVVFDQFDGDATVADDYPPTDNGGPCGAPAFYFDAQTDTASTVFMPVRLVHTTDDYKGVDSFAVGKRASGVAIQWYHGTATDQYIIVRSLDTYNDANSATFGAVGPRTRTYSGTQFMGWGLNYGALGVGFWYSYVDWTTQQTAFPAMLDTDGAYNISFFNNTTTQNATTLDAASQTMHWGTRADEIPAAASTRVSSGPQNQYWYIDDAAELKSTDGYQIANAAANYVLTPAGADGGPNETYSTTDMYVDGTNAPVCFHQYGPAWALFVQDCQLPDASTLNAPADGATGVANPPSFDFTPGTILPTDFSCRIYKNSNIVHEMTGILIPSFTLDTALFAPDGVTPAVGAAYQWTMFSNAGDSCPGVEAPHFSFRLAGCWADYNADGTVDFFDYLDFVGDFAANSNNADFNADGSIDFFDYLDFVQFFADGSGC